MNILQIHISIANSVVLFNTLLGLWGFIDFFRGKKTISGNYWGALALSPVVGLVQLTLGLIMISMGLGVAVRFVHYLYGALVIIAVPATFAFTHGRDDRGALLIYAALCLLTAAFGLRGVTTGYGF